MSLVRRGREKSCRAKQDIARVGVLFHDDAGSSGMKFKRVNELSFQLGLIW